MFDKYDLIIDICFGQNEKWNKKALSFRTKQIMGDENIQ